MDFSKSLKAGLSQLPLKTMSGQQKFLAVAAYCANGDASVAVEVARVRKEWPAGLIGVSYHANYYSRADAAGWVISTGKGILNVTTEGLEHLSALTEVSETKKSGVAGLHVFDAGHTHNFDKFLRGIFALAQGRVWVADAYVDENVFDNVLDVIPQTTEIHLLYNHKKGFFDARAARFAKQYSKYASKEYGALHDRFLLVDNTGYVIGPSIKDAASKSPALVVVLNSTDSTKLEKFFQTLWARGK